MKFRNVFCQVFVSSENIDKSLTKLKLPSRYKWKLNTHLPRVPRRNKLLLCTQLLQMKLLMCVLSSHQCGEERAVFFLEFLVCISKTQLRHTAFCADIESASGHQGLDKDFWHLWHECIFFLFSVWSEMELDYKWWKCDLQFPTCLHLNWFFWERNERCHTANHYSEQLTSVTACWWHWLHQTKRKIRSLSWDLSRQESLACETGQGLEGSHWGIFKGCECF